MTEPVHTLQEAANLLRMPYRTLRDAVYQGRWPHIRVSQRRRLMTDSDIEEVLRLQRQAPWEPLSTGTERQMRANVRNLLS